MDKTISNETLPEGIISVIIVFSAFNIAGSFLPFSAIFLTILVDFILRPAGGLGLMVIAYMTMRKRVPQPKGIVSWGIFSLSFIFPWFASLEPEKKILLLFASLSMLGLVIGIDLLFGLANKMRAVLYPLSVLYAIVSGFVFIYYFEGDGIAIIVFYYLKAILQILFWGGMVYAILKNKIFLISLADLPMDTLKTDKDLLFPSVNKKSEEN